MENDNKSLQIHKENIFVKIKNFFYKIFFKPKDDECIINNVNEKVTIEVKDSPNDLQTKIQKAQNQERLKLLIKKDKESVHSLTDEEIDEMIAYYKNYVSDLKRKVRSKELELRKLENGLSN